MSDCNLDGGEVPVRKRTGPCVPVAHRGPLVEYRVQKAEGFVEVGRFFPPSFFPGKKHGSKYFTVQSVLNSLHPHKSYEHLVRVSYDHILNYTQAISGGLQ